MSGARLAHACVLALVTPLGFATKLYAGPGSTWVATRAGGFFYVLFWVFLVLTLFPAWSARAVAVWVFAVTSALEVSQLWHPPLLESVRSTFLGHALLGSTFSWADFAYYALAVPCAPLLARAARAGTSCLEGDRPGAAE